jgi:hypothetical protein
MQLEGTKVRNLLSILSRLAHRAGIRPTAVARPIRRHHQSGAAGMGANTRWAKANS